MVSEQKPAAAMPELKDEEHTAPAEDENESRPLDDSELEQVAGGWWAEDDKYKKWAELPDGSGDGFGE